MRTAMAIKLAVAACLLGGLCAAHRAFGNGGPFVVKYPSGDPAAKGVLARLDPTLKPAQETRLRVIKEDLMIGFGSEKRFSGREASPPLVDVSAAYSIENPTDEEVQIDFGFPILRGIYLNPFTMMPMPDVRVQVDKEQARPTVISNSVIYGTIRQNAREVIEKGIAADAELVSLTAAVRAAWIAPPATPIQQSNAQQAAPRASARPVVKPERRPTTEYLPAREKLRDYLKANLHWNGRDAALMVEYASLDFGVQRSMPRDRWNHGWGKEARELAKLAAQNMGPLAAISEQKATQFFAQLASRFDKATTDSYEAIFTAWGGDVRERSIDLATGKIRPREVEIPKPKAAEARPGIPSNAVLFVDRRLTADPTVYARVDYLDPTAKISEEEKASCQAILKNLPVVFTFAPMNLLHYQVKFPAHSTRTVTVSYKQYAYADTRGSGSYQLAYVLHPATLWNEFGPINVKVSVPTGIAYRASATLHPVKPGAESSPTIAYEAALTELKDKSGELFVGIDKAAWDAQNPPKGQPKNEPSRKNIQPMQQQSRPTVLN